MKPHQTGYEVAAIASTLGEADVMAASLNAAGIPAYVVDAHINNTLMVMGFVLSPNGIRVATPADRVDEARELLNLATREGE